MADTSREAVEAKINELLTGVWLMQNPDASIGYSSEPKEAVAIILALLSRAEKAEADLDDLRQENAMLEEANLRLGNAGVERDQARAENARLKARIEAAEKVIGGVLDSPSCQCAPGEFLSVHRDVADSARAFTDKWGK